MSKDKDKRNKYKRFCPKCNVELSYSRRCNRDNADKQKTMCYKCANNKSGLNFAFIDGKYKRVCPKCGKLNCEYRSEITARISEKNGKICRSCSAKNRKGKLDATKTTRKCPSCGKTVKHSNVYKARAASKNNCTKCSRKNKKKRTYNGSSYKTSVSYKYYYLYETTNTVTGKVYVGVRSTNNLNDGYIGCGVYSQDSALKRSKKTNSHFIQSVVKYGYDSFSKRIMSFFDNADLAYKAEREIVNAEWVMRDDNYNVSIGGKYQRCVSKYEKYRKEWEKLYSDGVGVCEIARRYSLSSHASVSLMLNKKPNGKYEQKNN